MKKFLCVMIAVVIALSSMTILAFADAPNITMTADKTNNVNIGDVITVTVKVAEGSNLCSATLDVVYDKECFEVVKDSMKATEAMGPTLNENFAENKARYIGTLERFLKNEANLFTIQFKVLKRGGNISIEAVEVYHIDGVERKDVTSTVNNSLKDDTISIACPHTEKTTETTAATCSKEGKKVETCKECGYKTETVIAKLPHTPKDIVTKEATCKEAGEKAKQCTVCNEIYDKTAVPALPHDMKDAVIEKATCQKEGKEGKKCTMCGLTSDEKVIPKTSHDMKTVVITEATCETAGKKVEQCANCEYKEAEKEIPAKGHTEGKWETVKVPTKTEAGLEQKKCTVCGAVIESREIPKAISYKLGDVNEDGHITAVDARLVLQEVAGLVELNTAKRLAADVNGDKQITAVDARIILQHVAGLKTI